MRLDFAVIGFIFQGDGPFMNKVKILSSYKKIQQHLYEAFVSQCRSTSNVH